MTIDSPSLSALRADISAAVRLVAPYWPLTSFVAVNPLGGLVDERFDDACAMAEHWFGARTHLGLDRYRDARRRGVISDADLRVAIAAVVPQLADGAPLELGGRRVAVIDLVHGDLLDGPTGAHRDVLTVAAGHRGIDGDIDNYIASWCAAFVDEAGAPMPMPARERGFYAAWHALAATDRRLRRLVGRAGRSRVAAMPEEPLPALAAALGELGVADDERVDSLRSLALRLPGWLGLARWNDDWAPADRTGPRLHVVDLLAMMAVIEAAVGGPPSRTDLRHARRVDEAAHLVETRADAALHRLGLTNPTSAERMAVTTVIDQLPERARSAMWLTAHEIAFRDRLLTTLDRPGVTPRSAGRPSAQLVTCIDVRSEVLRRHLEEVGPYETYGFAGFFGMPVRWRPHGSAVGENRCPVLVKPNHEVGETAGGGEAPPGGLAAGAHAAMHDAKGALGSPFALAESAGWLLGPLAGLRTAAGGAVPRLAGRSPATSVLAAAEDHERWGLPLTERVLYAEALLATIALVPVAPLVVLCGHGSHTVNNPQASSLDCGACGGAPGEASARVAAAVLNDPLVRAGLAERDRPVPEDTWFVAAEHDTASDHVSILDRHLVPARLAAALEALEQDLATAGARTAAERATRLPGDPGRVRRRGRDWAQVRPEWGLAGNAAFVAGPRSMTAGRDLAGRVFLHSYDPCCDPDGVALETILTAPLVVAQWISSQYYFSTVDPDVFGAGDKVLHNPVGGVGVVLGPEGDLAVGLARQSVMVGERLAHEPLRLLAVVQAPLERIDDILARNPGVAALVDHQWIHLVARPSGDRPWQLRRAGGGWVPWRPAHPRSESCSLEVS